MPDQNHPNALILKDFYTAFSQRDSAKMREFYAKEATFEDPAFVLNGGDRIADMWEMLCKRGKDLELTHELLDVNDQGGTVKWEAHYTFSQTGRKVHNIITAHIKIKDGKFIEHRDDFDFWRWSKQALGAPGLLLGWSGFLKNKVRQMAGKGLDQYIAASPS